MRKYRQTIGRRRAMKSKGKKPPSQTMMDAAILSQAPQGFDIARRSRHRREQESHDLFAGGTGGKGEDGGT